MKVYRSIFFVFIFLGFILSDSISFAQCGFTNLNTTYCNGDAAFTLTGGTNYYGPGISGTTFNPSSLSSGTYTLVTTNDLTNTYNTVTAGTFNPLTLATPTLVSLTDNTSALINFPTAFSFSFFGSDYTSVYIYDNGFVRFNANSGAGAVSQFIPDVTDPNNIIACAWSDLDPTTGTIEYGTVGTAPTRIFVINYSNVQFKASAEYVTTQIQLHEKSNIIEIHSTHIGSAGGNKTMGIEDNGGTVAYTGSGRNQSIWTADNDYISFVPACSEEKTVTILGGPSASLSVFPASLSVCAGSIVPITIGNSEVGIEYQLQNNSDSSPLSGFVAGNGSNLSMNTAALFATTTVKVFARNTSTLCGLDLTNQATITINQTPTIANADIDQNKCNNGSFTLSGNSPTTGTGTWTLVSGTATITTPGLNSSTVTGIPVGSSATLRWTISNGVCTPSSDDVVLTNYQSPTTSDAGVAQQQCTNGTFILSGNSPTIGTGTWTLVSGTAIITTPGLNSSTVTGVPVGSSATLRWTISNGVCTPSSDDVVLTNYQTPTIANADIDQNKCNNGSFTLSGNSPTTGTGTWTLVSGTATITTPGLNSSTVTGIPVGSSATLRWTISNGVCTPSSDDVVLTNYQSPTTSDAGVAQQQCTNGTFILSGNSPTIGTGTWTLVSGTATITTPGLNSSTVTGVPVGSSATLRWTISNGVCTPSSDDVVLTNYQTPTIATADIDQNKCNNGSFTLSGNSPTTGTGTWTLVSGTATITTPGLNSSTVTSIPVGSSATLRWTISNGVCTPSSDDVVLTNYQSPTTSDAGVAQQQCTNGTFILSGNSPVNGTGLWSVINGTAIISNPSVSGSTVTGVPVGSSATLRWTISNGVCTPSSDDVVLTNYQTPTIANADIDQNKCNNGSFTLSGNIPTTGTGTWTLVSGTATITTPGLNSSTVTGVPVGSSATLRWTISNGVCTPSSDDVVLTNYQSPTTSDAGVAQQQCTNGTFILSGNLPTIGTGTWTLVSGTATITTPGLNSSTVTGVPVGSSATLRWTISNGVCTPSSDDVVLTNYQTPTIANADIDQNKCNNGSFTLSGNSPTTGTGAWTLVSGTATITTPGLNSSTVTGIPVGSSATLRWTISNGVCTPSSDDVVLTNYQSPTTSDAGVAQQQCTNGTFILSGNLPTIGTGTWTLVSGTATITTPGLNSSTVTGVPVGSSATLRWTISNGVCTPSSDDVVLTNYQTPTIANADIDQDKCNNGSFTLSGNIPTTGTGTWTLVSGTATITTPGLNSSTVTSIPVGSSATLRWTISNGVCTPSSDDVVITNYQSPTTSDAGVAQQQCTNGTFILSGNSPVNGTGLWSVISGTATITTPGLNSSTVTGVPVGSSATLRWTISNGVCTPSSDDVVITNYQTPTIANADIDQNKCNNGSFTLSGNSPTTGTGAWTLVSGTASITTPGLNSSTVTGVPVGSSATLRWTISNGVCTPSSDDVVLTNYQSPTTSDAGVAQQQCTNGTFILSGNTPVNGTGLWSVISGTAVISNPSVSGSTVTGVPVGSSATLRWTISNGVCTPSSDDVVLTNYQTPTIANADIDQNQCNNGSFTLSGNIPTTGTGTWTLVSGTATITTPGLNSSTVTGIPVGSSATLRWTISNGVCTPSSDDVVLTNYQSPTTSDAGVAQQQCTNGTFILSGNSPTIGTGTWTLVSGTATITTPGLNSSTVTGVGSSATLRWTISNGVCTPSSDDVVLTNYQTPTIANADIDQNQCNNGSFTLSGNSPTTGTGTWTLVSGTATITTPGLNSSTVTSIPVGSSATLRWTISNGVCTPSSDDVVLTNYQSPTTSDAGVAQQQCTNGTFILSGNSPTIGTGTWTLVSGTATITTPGLNSSTVTGVGSSATLRWTISNGVCTPSSDDVVLTNYQTPTIANADIDQNKCNNGSFTLSGNSPTTGTGTWTLVSGTATITTPGLNSSTVTGIPVGSSATLRWTISNGVCTPSSDDVVLTNYQSPTTSDAGVAQQQCTNGTFILSGNSPVNGTGLWSVISGTAIISNPSVNGSTVTGVPVGSSATLRWTISNGVCTPSSDDVVLTNYQTPTIANADIDQDKCNNGSFTLSGNSPTTGTGTWTLVSGTATITTPGLNSSTVTSIPVGSSATLRWTISNGVCTPSSDDVVLTNYQSPTTSDAGVAQQQCTNGTFILSGNLPTIGTGTWTLVSGTATITTPGLNSSTVTGVPVGSSATLRWTISNGVCTPSSDDVVLTNYQTPTIANADIDQNQCNNGSFTLSGNSPTTGTGTWTLVSGTATITTPGLNSSTVTGIPVGSSATLRWTISNGVCTPSSDDVVLTNYQSPTTSDAGVAQQQCTNGTFILSGNTPVNGTGLWSVISGTATITTPGLNSSTVTGVPVGSSATLRWTISNGVCTPSSDDVVLTNYQTPTIATADIDQNKCNNGSFTLSGNSPTTGTGTWTLVSGTATITTPGLNSSTVTGIPVGSSATLRWTISNGVCTPSSDDVILTNYQSPTTSDAGVAQQQCTNGTFILSGNSPTIGTGLWTLVSGTATITTPGLNSSTVTGVPVGSSATLRWTISNGVCTPSSDDVVLTNYQTPTIANADIDQNQCNNGSFTLSGNSPTTGTGTWTLVSGTATITTPGLNSSTVTSIPVGSSATLRWTISNGVCTPSSDDVVLTNYQSPTTSDAGVAQQQCTNGTFILSGNSPTIGTGTWTLVSGTATITTPGLNSSIVTGVPVGSSATLRWTISNGVCTPSSDDVVLTNYQTPTTSDAGVDQSNCGTNASLNANAPITGTGSWMIVSGIGGNVAVPTSRTSLFTGVAGTTYILRWTTVNGVCSSQDDVQIILKRIPDVAASGKTICSGENIDIGITNPNGVTGTTFSWIIVSPNNVTGASAGNGPTISQSLHSTDGITQGQVVYRVTPIADGCPGNYIDITVYVNPVPVITNTPAGLINSICSGVTLNFTPTSTIGSTIMTWSSTNATSGTGAITENLVNSTSATQTVTYTITPSVGTCSGSPVNYVVDVKPLPSASGTSVIICSDDIAQINLSPSPKNVSGTSFVWTASPSSNVVGASNGNGSLISQKLNTTDASVGFVTYHITPTAFGCDGPITDIVAQVNPKVTVNAGADYSVCEPATIVVSGFIGGSATTGTWTIVKGNGTLSASSSGTTVTSNYTVAANDITDGYITLRLTTDDSDGAQPCSLLSDDLRIDIHTKATVTVPSDYTVCEPSQINLLGTVGGGAISGTWNLISGNGTLSVSSVTVNGASKDVTAIYYPNVTDVNTIVKFRLTTDDPDGPGVLGPCVNESADLKITINKSAKVNAGVDFEVCEDGYVQLNASYSGSTSSVIWSENSLTGNAQFSDVTSVNSKYFLRPGIDVGSIIFTLTTNDPDGSGPSGPCTNQSDNVIVTINKLPVVALTNLNSIYQEDDNIVTMAGFPSGAGGVFTGSGVIAGTNKFDPANANIGLNTITYTYTDSKSCTNSISKTITVNSLTTIDFGIIISGSPVNNGIGLPEIEICANIGIARLKGMPKYTDGLTPTVDTYFKGVISAPLIIVALDASGYYINTDGLAPGDYYIQYTFKDAITTATSSLTKKIIIKEAPIAIIGATDHCIDSPVQFTDLSTPLVTIDTWTWDFDDGGTQSNLQNPIHDYSLTQPRSHLITLKVTTTQGCTNATTKSIIIGSPPIPDFNWTKLCSGDATRFSNSSTIVTGAINGYGWDFDDGNTTSVSSGAIVPADDNGGRTSGTYKDPKHKYDNFGDFNVTLSVSTSEGCIKTVTKRIYILKAPSIAVDGYYSESFTEDVSSWIKTDLSSSWVFDDPQGDIIKNAYTGSKVWWTGANTNKETERSTYFNNERSDIIGPCLNLSTIKRPMISLHYWSDLQTGFDGAVVQYSTDGALTWKTIGDAGGAGIDWYTSKNLISSPGDQQNYAWSGGDSGWKNARFNLDQIPIEKRDTVVFRVAFGSDGSNPNIPDKIFNGFAFDDIYIGEKQRSVLIEHFTNIPTVNAATYLDNLYDFQTDPAQTTYKAESDFIKIQYHMGNPNKEDSIYKVNPFDPTARAFYYQVSQPPFTIMDGLLGYFGDDRDSLVLNGDHALLNSEVIDQRALEDPLFKLAVDFSASDESRLKASVSVTYIDSLHAYNSSVIFHAALVEKNIGSLRNVVKKLLPDVEGKLLSGPWQKGTQIIVPLDYKMDVHITNPDDLYLVTFVQDKITGLVQQSFTIKAPRLAGPQVVGLPDEPLIAELSGLRIYPNPASHVINFEHGKLLGSYTWKIIDQRGVAVLSGKLENNLAEPQVVDISDLANAMYIVVIGTENGSIIHEKIAVMNQH